MSQALVGQKGDDQPAEYYESSQEDSLETDFSFDEGSSDRIQEVSLMQEGESESESQTSTSNN